MRYPAGSTEVPPMLPAVAAPEAVETQVMDPEMAERAAAFHAQASGARVQLPDSQPPPGYFESKKEEPVHPVPKIPKGPKARVYMFIVFFLNCSKFKVSTIYCFNYILYVLQTL